MASLVSWFVLTAMLWDVSQHNFTWTKGIVLCAVAGCLAYWAYALRYTFGGRAAAGAAKSPGGSHEYLGVRKSDQQVTKRGHG